MSDRNHAPWCSVAHDGPCATESDERYRLAALLDGVNAACEGWQRDCVAARVERDRLREALEQIAEHAREWCREDLGAEHNYDRCNAPAEFILWRKLIAPEGLGPRCYDHAAKHVGHDALRRDSGWAIFDLRPLLLVWFPRRTRAMPDGRYRTIVADPPWPYRSATTGNFTIPK